MYIENKYWNNYIGDTDDSLNLIAFLEDQDSNEISFSFINPACGYNIPEVLSSYSKMSFLPQQPSLLIE